MSTHARTRQGQERKKTQKSSKEEEDKPSLLEMKNKLKQLESLENVWVARIRIWQYGIIYHTWAQSITMCCCCCCCCYVCAYCDVESSTSGDIGVCDNQWVGTHGQQGEQERRDPATHRTVLCTFKRHWVKDEFAYSTLSATTATARVAFGSWRAVCVKWQRQTHSQTIAATIQT